MNLCVFVSVTFTNQDVTKNFKKVWPLRNLNKTKLFFNVAFKKCQQVRIQHTIWTPTQGMITSWKVHHLSYVCMNIQENPVCTNSFSTMWQNLSEKGQLRNLNKTKLFFNVAFKKCQQVRIQHTRIHRNLENTLVF
jgi:hypothetical protein